MNNGNFYRFMVLPLLLIVMNHAYAGGAFVREKAAPNDRVNYGIHSLAINADDGHGILAQDFTDEANNIVFLAWNSKTSKYEPKWKIDQVGFIYDMEQFADNAGRTHAAVIVADPKILKRVLKIIEIKKDAYRVSDFPLEYEAEQVAAKEMDGEIILCVSIVTGRLDDEAECSLISYRMRNDKLQKISEIKNRFNISDIKFVKEGAGSAADLVASEDGKTNIKNAFTMKRMLSFYKIESAGLRNVDNIKFDSKVKIPYPILALSQDKGNLYLADDKRVKRFDLAAKKITDEELIKSFDEEKIRGFSSSIDEAGNEVLLTIQGIKHGKVSPVLYKNK